MSQPKMYSAQLHIIITPGERALLDYYAAKYGKDRTEIVRGMLRRYVDADKRFDPDDFLDYVKKTLLPKETDKEQREQLKEQAATIAETRKRGERKAATFSGIK